MLLQAQALSISFGGLKAVQDVSLAVPAGSISALVGPNSAGKTTLFGLLSGFLRPDQGKVCCSTAGTSPAWRRSAPRAWAWRAPSRSCSPSARRPCARTSPSARTCACRGGPTLAAAEAIARRVNLGAQLDKPAADLTVCGRKRLELARALATGPGCCCWTRCWRG